MKKHGDGFYFHFNKSKIQQNWYEGKLNPYYVHASNIQMNELFTKEFKLVYDQLYSHSTTTEELNTVKSQCNQDSIICGGADSLKITLVLVSCGSCLDILTNNTNQTRLVNGAWWYFKPGESFGFAPNSNIEINNWESADMSDCNSSQF
jgi:hypothetical protein